MSEKKESGRCNNTVVMNRSKQTTFKNADMSRAASKNLVGIPTDVPTTVSGLPDMRCKEAKAFVAEQGSKFAQKKIPLPDWVPQKKDGSIDTNTAIGQNFATASKAGQKDSGSSSKTVVKNKPEPKAASSTSHSIKSGQEEIIGWNLRSILAKGGKKLEFLQDRTKCAMVSFILLNETWVGENTTDLEIIDYLPDYSIHRADRQRLRSGGVAILSRRTLEAKLLAAHDDDVCQAVVVECPLDNKVVATVYRRPQSVYNSFENLIAFLNRELKKAKANDKELLVYGDFNLPDWENPGMDGKGEHKLLSTFAEKWNLSQLVDAPTRGKNKLDLFFTNKRNRVKSTIIVKCGELSDHDLVSVTLG